MNTKVIALPRQGSLFGSILLICGSSIGAGILALPVLTAEAGALPTLVVFTICWLLMSVTALLLLESRLAAPKDTNLISMTKRSLNRYGQAAVLLSFLFLFYSLITAYIAKGGEMTYAILNQSVPGALPAWSGPVLITAVSAGIVLFGPRIIDRINRFFMAGLFAAYFFLTFSGVSYFERANIAHSDWSYLLFIVPFIVTSFGYHNMIPSIHEYLGNDRKKLLASIFVSGGVLFALYTFWVICFHGVIPLSDFRMSLASGEIVTQPLARLIQAPVVQFCAVYMAFFAIITSLLGQGLSIIDFLADTFKVERTRKNRLALCLALFVPTFTFSQLIPGVFFKALELAGGIAAMILFGIIPALMSWVNRYRRPALSVRPLVPGGKVVLIVVIALSSLVIGYEIAKNLF